MGDVGVGAFEGVGTVSDSFGQTVVDVPPETWHGAVAMARDEFGCAFFDFLTAVDEAPGLRVVCRVVRRPAGQTPLLSVLLRTDANGPVPSIADLYVGARWHERETSEMFGVVFAEPGSGEPIDLGGLLLPDGFEGHPLRKDFALVAREEKPWPGAKR